MDKKEAIAFDEDKKVPTMRNTVAYRETPFSVETPLDEFYKFMTVTEMSVADSKLMSVRVRCRTIGMLHTSNGQYCLKNMDRHESNSCEVLVSFEYLPQPPKPAVVPYTAQIFGFLGFEGKDPVIYATLVQPLAYNTASEINNMMNLICKMHLATSCGKMQQNEDLCEMLDNRL